LGALCRGLADPRSPRPLRANTYPPQNTPDEERVNKVVFIGKNLDRQELTDGFKACLEPAAA
jgi:G3E family GTPase